MYLIIEHKRHEAKKVNKLQIEIEKSIIIVGNLNTPSVTDRSSRQKMSNNTIELNSTINQLDLIDIYEKLHPTRAAYTFFFQTHMEHLPK